MRRRWWRALRDLAGRTDRDLVARLTAQLDAALDGAGVAREAVTGGDPAVAAERMEEIERRGDAERAELVSILGEVLTGPIDREDLFRLSRSIDDVLDNLSDFVVELTLYRPARPEGLAEPIDSVIEGIRALRDGLPALPGDTEAAARGALRARRACNRTRRRYQEAVADLLERDPDRETLKHRELLRRLDVVGLRLAEAANALTDGLIKRGA